MQPQPAQGSLAAQQLQEEQRREVERYYETMTLMQADAIRAQEAQQRESTEQLKVDTERLTKRVSSLKDKALILSAENVSKQELAESMQARLTEQASELSRLQGMQRSSGPVRQTENQRVTALTTIFESTMDRCARKLSDRQSSYIPESLRAKSVGAGPTVTKVYHTPDGQPREVAAGTLEMRLGRTTTFREICHNAARFFGENPATAVLEDEHGTVWPWDTPASREIARYRGDQTIRLVRRDEAAAEAARGGGGGFDDDDEPHDDNEPTTQGLLAMLGNSNSALPGGPGGGDGIEMGELGMGEDGEDGIAAAQAAAQLAAMEDSDSDDDDLQKKEYVEPPLNRRREYFDMALHILFLILLFQSVSEKRTLRDAYALTEALRTVFVEEEFGDYNEKTFTDVRNFEEAWEWTNGVLIDGLFESDVDDTGNIMMYNQLVGSVRLRQLRVTNTSCELSPRIQRRVEVTNVDFTQSFVFQAPNLGDGGGCFFAYRAEGGYRDTSDYGPCTERGRDALLTVPELSLEQLNKYNESCGGSEPTTGSGFKYYPESKVQGVRTFFNDGGGYVRDINPDEPLPGADIPRVPKDRMIEDLDELNKMLWLDERTRAIIISFSVYNANFNLYAACNFCFEFSPGGTIRPISRFKVMKIDLYEGVQETADILRFDSVEVQYDAAVMILLFRMILRELSRYIYIRWTYGTSMPYISNIWNMLEIANITPFIIAWATRLSFASNPLRSTYSLGMFATRYAELGPVADSYTLAFAFDSISIVVSFLKLFKYFRLFDATALLWNVLESSAADMSYFFFMLVLFLIAFTMFAEQMFGPTMYLFSEPILSMTTLFNQIFGVVDIYWDMVRTAQEPFLAIAFFFAYTILIFFILVNVFLAILNDAYSSVKGARDERMAQKKAEAEEAARLKPPDSTSARIARLQRAARGRFHRFQSRVSAMAKRRKANPVNTVTDAVDSIHLGAPVSGLDSKQTYTSNYDY